MIVAEPVPFCIDHVPPAVASVNAGVLAFTQTEAAPPPIAATTGKELPVTIAFPVIEMLQLVVELVAITV